MKHSSPPHPKLPGKKLPDGMEPRSRAAVSADGNRKGDALFRPSERFSLDEKDSPVNGTSAPVFRLMSDS